MRATPAAARPRGPVAAVASGYSVLGAVSLILGLCSGSVVALVDSPWTGGASAEIAGRARHLLYAAAAAVAVGVVALPGAFGLFRGRRWAYRLLQGLAAVMVPSALLVSLGLLRMALDLARGLSLVTQLEQPAGGVAGLLFYAGLALAGALQPLGLAVLLGGSIRLLQRHLPPRRHAG